MRRSPAWCWRRWPESACSSAARRSVSSSWESWSPSGSVGALDDSSAIGVVLAGSFAVGVLMLSARPGSSQDLSAFLVGSDPHGHAARTSHDRGIVGVLVLVVLAALHKELVHGAFDPGRPRRPGLLDKALDLAGARRVTVTLVTAVPAVGTLLAVALLTVPALTARRGPSASAR